MCLTDLQAKRKLRDRVSEGLHTRILAYGSSNTARRLEGMHWFDCLDLAIHQKFGRIHTCINTGVGGDTTRDLIDRFERDAEFYQPDIAFITIGGNDSNPTRHLPHEEFRDNLLLLHDRFSRLGTLVVFQTYYSVREDMIEADTFRRFHEFMAIIRSTAADTGADIIDHISRWEKLRKENLLLYRSLMADGMHVNSAGNLVLGMDLAAAFGLSLSDNKSGFWRQSMEIRNLIDSLF
jgi:lysophospholipase L1-like esterase